MIKAEKKTLKLSVEKPQYITVNDVTYAQVDSWFGHCRRDLKLDIISFSGGSCASDKRWKNLSLHPLDLRRRMADDG